jgi:hypothetical protein
MAEAHTAAAIPPRAQSSVPAMHATGERTASASSHVASGEHPGQTAPAGAAIPGSKRTAREMKRLARKLRRMMRKQDQDQDLQNPSPVH